MKRIALGLLFLLPAVSFAAPLTDVQRASIIQELAALETELQALEAEVNTSVEATSTPVSITAETLNTIVDPLAPTYTTQADGSVVELIPIKGEPNCFTEVDTFTNGHKEFEGRMCGG